MKYLTKSAEDTENLGKNLSVNIKTNKKSPSSRVYLLMGDLGGGKTQFVKGLAKGLGVTEEVISPTFTFEKIYKAKDGLLLYHFDLYRSEVLDEDIRLALLEAFVDKEGVVAVEWAERAREVWPKDATKVNFEWKDENEREIEIES